MVSTVQLNQSFLVSTGDHPQAKPRPPSKSYIANHSFHCFRLLAIVESMFSNNEITDALQALGSRLRQARIAKGDSQAVFAQRIGVSVPTLRDLEQGNPRVSVGAWGAALWVLSRLPDMELLLQPQESLFEQIVRQSATRQRAPRRVKAVSAP